MSAGGHESVDQAAVVDLALRLMLEWVKAGRGSAQPMMTEFIALAHAAVANGYGAKAASQEAVHEC